MTPGLNINLKSLKTWSKEGLVVSLLLMVVLKKDMDLVITNCQPTSLHYEKVLLKKICLFKRVLYTSPVCSVNAKNTIHMCGT